MPAHPDAGPTHISVLLSILQRVFLENRGNKMGNHDEFSVADLSKLELLTEAFSSMGEPCDIGISENDAHITFLRVQELFPSKNVVTVKHWCWQDIYRGGGHDGRDHQPSHTLINANEIIESNHWNTACDLATG